MASYEMRTRLSPLFCFFPPDEMVARVGEGRRSRSFFKPMRHLFFSPRSCRNGGYRRPGHPPPLFTPPFVDFCSSVSFPSFHPLRSSCRGPIETARRRLPPLADFFSSFLTLVATQLTFLSLAPSSPLSRLPPNRRSSSHRTLGSFNREELRV